MSDQILLKSTKMLTRSIIKIAQGDKIEVTAACDEWTNVKQENLFGVVFITSMGKILIWDARDISAERSKTENVINHIKDIMAKVEKKQIKINCFVSDSAGECAATQYVFSIKNNTI